MVLYSDICFYHNGKINTGITVFNHIENIIKMDAIAEIIVTNISQEGMMTGFDTDLYLKLKDFKIRILVNGGGCSNEENIRDVFCLDNIYGACFSSLFFFTRYTPNDIKKILKQYNIDCVNSNQV